MYEKTQLWHKYDSQASIHINSWSLYPVSTVMFSVKTITGMLLGGGGGTKLDGGGRLSILDAGKPLERRFYSES